MSDMQRDLEQLGTQLWPDTEALRPEKAAGGTPTVIPPKRHRGLEPLLALATSAILIAGLVAAVALGRTSAPRTAAPVPPKPTAPVASVSAAQLAAGHWSVLPPAPITPRTGASVVWTGTELLVWGGGSSAAGQTLHSDGAAYNPRTGRWRSLPPAPLSSRVEQTAAWDGAEMIIWGGYDQLSALHVTNDGAAYDPQTDRWRMLPPAPLSARAQVISTWTGTDLILLGGYPAVTRDFNSFHDGASYDPSTDRWTAILPPTPPPGHPVAWRAAVQAGDKLLAFSDWATTTSCGGGCVTGDSGTDLFTYNEQTAAWHFVSPASGALHGTEQVLWTGQFAIVRGGGWCGACAGPAQPLQSAEYDPMRNTWITLAADPIAWGHPLSTWVGTALFSFNADASVGSPSGTISPGDATAYDPGGSWIKLPSAPNGCGSPPVDSIVWTGHQVLLYCPSPGQWSAAAPSGLAYTVGS